MKTNIKIGNRIKAVNFEGLGPTAKKQILNKVFVCTGTSMGRGGDEYVTFKDDDFGRMTYFAWRFIQLPSLVRKCYGK